LVKQFKDLCLSEVASAAGRGYLQAEEFRRRRHAIQTRVREISAVRGISVDYIISEFRDAAIKNTKNQDPIFHEICPKLAMGENGIGFNQICPRDARLHSSIVDGVDDEHSKQATDFVSWCWDYNLNTVVSALRTYAKKHSRRATAVFVWICFFCNNQYRILGEETKLGVEYLKHIFKSHLLNVGRMLILMDNFSDPRYIRRIWCVHEVFVQATTEPKIPLEIIMPEGAIDELLDMNAKAVKTSLGDIDAEKATATHTEDAECIKSMIKQEIGFATVNKKVKENLVRCFMETQSAYLMYEA